MVFQNRNLNDVYDNKQYIHKHIKLSDVMHKYIFLQLWR